MGQARTLMVQGCTSNAGKSLLVTALCRIARDAGLRVAPFKPQNMANNSAVTTDGGEIGRAQALQAQAAGIELHSNLNPVLLKPTGDSGSQVIIQGRVIGNMSARDYMDFRPIAFKAVLESHEALKNQYDLIIVEGAGSPAEINLRQHDIANMGFAEAVDCPVWLIGNIDYGGVFAHLYGTLALLSNSEQQRVTRLLINGFRGDESLLHPAIKWLEDNAHKPVSAVIPMVPNLLLDAEDSLSLNHGIHAGPFKIAVPILSRLSNHSDFDPLASHPQVELIWVRPGQLLPKADLIILPGSKSTISDLNKLKENGWHKDIAAHVLRGKKIIGICGGYQMLGQTISDPHKIESNIESTDGLGLLPITTELLDRKTLGNTKGTLWDGTPFSGYEIHLGTTRVTGSVNTFSYRDGDKADGSINLENTVLGTYMHGIFEHPMALKRLLAWAGLKNIQAHDYVTQRERQLDRFAGIVKNHLDANALGELLEMDHCSK